MVLDRRNGAGVHSERPFDRRPPARSRSPSSSTDTSSSSLAPPPWIEENITALECSKYVVAKRSPVLNSRCCCGLTLNEHSNEVRLDALARLGSEAFRSLTSRRSLGNQPNFHNTMDRWHVKTHTHEIPTNAYGTVEFQGGPHPTKARYVRLSYDTSPEVVLHLLLHEWRLRVPNLVISTLGGLVNAPLQTKLQRVVQSGLLRAAKTTGAWVITNGLDTGVTRHIGDALGDELHVRGSNIVALGIAPWGYVQHRETLIGLNHTSTYYAQDWTPGRLETPLHSHHNYFLLSDNGTVGKLGSELCLRRRLEQYLAQQPIDMRRYGGCKSHVPIVGVLLEGGAQTFRTVFELITGRHPVPVVVCDGSGRASDLIAFMHRYANEDGDLNSRLKEQVITNISRTFKLRRQESEGVYSELRLCMKRRHLITVFRMGEGDSDEIDIAILTALLQVSGRKLTTAEQLSLTMAWDRPDVARSKLFTSGVLWSPSTLENAMADALLNDRLEFVRLLLAKGVDIQHFLTVTRLEGLYTVAEDVNNQSFHNLFAKVMGTRQIITLRTIGQLIENLIGAGYQHSYCDKTAFGRLPARTKPVTNSVHADSLNRPNSFAIKTRSSSSPHGWNTLHQKSLTFAHLETAVVNAAGLHASIVGRLKSGQVPPVKCVSGDEFDRDAIFRYPYTELLQWALLTRRHNMARFMILAGEESIAKALFSVKLLRAIRHVMVDSETEADLFNEYRTFENSFEQLAVDLQHHCYRQDPHQSKNLLIYELHSFSNNTCLSLAYLCESKVFIAHPCTQSVLNDLWYGGLRKGYLVDAKVALMLIGLIFPPLYPLLAYCFTTGSKFFEFKTKEELAKLAQTLQKHLDELEDTSSSSSSSFSSSSSSSSFSSASSKSSLRHRPFPQTILHGHTGGVLGSALRGQGDELRRTSVVQSNKRKTQRQPHRFALGCSSIATAANVTAPISSKSSKLPVDPASQQTDPPNGTCSTVFEHDGSINAPQHLPQVLNSTGIVVDPSVDAEFTTERKQHGAASCARIPKTMKGRSKGEGLQSNILSPMYVDGHVTFSEPEHDNEATSEDPNKLSNMKTNLSESDITKYIKVAANSKRLAPVFYQSATSVNSTVPTDGPLLADRDFTTTGVTSLVTDERLAVSTRTHRLSLLSSRTVPTELQHMCNLPNSSLVDAGLIGKHGVTRRSNLARLVPASHYASVAGTRTFPIHRPSSGTKRRPSMDVVHPVEMELANLHDNRQQQQVNASFTSVPPDPSQLNGFSTDQEHFANQQLSYDSPNYYFQHQPVYPITTGSGGHQLSYRKRVYEFFNAPVTRFYLHVLLYIVFLVLFIGLCLHTLPPDSWSFLELYVYLHIITYFLDKFREVTLVAGMNYFHKLRVHLGAFWNIYDVIMCLFSVLGIALRYMGMLYAPWYMWGKNLLIICCAVWQMRFLELMQIWRFSGPYIYMLLKMIRVMVPMLALLFLPLLAFGTLREGIMYPNRTHISLEGVKGIMLKPYFMLYGEVYAGDIDPVDWPEESQNAPLMEAVPIFTVIYLLYSIILFISVIIATFNDVYASVRNESELVYNFLRYAVIIEYESRPLLPPPFVVLSWIYLFLQYVYRRFRKRRRNSSTNSSATNSSKKVSLHQKDPTSHGDQNAQSSVIADDPIVVGSEKSMRRKKQPLAEINLRDSSWNNSFAGLKLFLEPEEVEKLHDFEEECVDDYWRETRRTEKLAAELQEDVVNRKLDYLQFRVSEIHVQQGQMRALLHLMDESFHNLEEGRDYGHDSATLPINHQNELLKRRLTGLEEPKRPLTAVCGEVAKTRSSSFETSRRQHGEHYLNKQAVGTKCIAGQLSHIEPVSGKDRVASLRRVDRRLSSLSTGGQDYQRRRRPTLLSGASSYHGYDCTYREYTTICDNIDLTFLSVSDTSSSTSANTSQTHLDKIRFVRDVPISDSTQMPSQQVDVKRSTDSISRNDGSFVTSNVSGSSHATKQSGQGNKLSDMNKCSVHPSAFYIDADSPMLVSREPSYDSRSSDEFALNAEPCSSSNFSCRYKPTTSLSNTPSVPTCFSSLTLTKQTSPVFTLASGQTESVHRTPIDGGVSKHTKFEPSSNAIHILPSLNEMLPSSSVWDADNQPVAAPDNEESVDEILSGEADLWKAEKIERAELRGAFIRRLHKLSAPKFVVSDPHVNMEECFEEEEDDNISALSKISQLRSDDCFQKPEYHRHRTEHHQRLYTRPHHRSVAKPKNLSSVFSPADVGDFLQHNIDEDQNTVVDPDLDLDLDHYSDSICSTPLRRPQSPQRLPQSSSSRNSKQAGSACANFAPTC